MIAGVGTDIVDVPAFRRQLGDTASSFVAATFTASERRACEGRASADPAIHLAARFAAKEAVMKSLGTGWTDGVGFHEIEVTSDGKTPPLIRISGRTAELAAEAGIAGFRVSMSHTDHLAIAMVVAELA